MKRGAVGQQGFSPDHSTPGLAGEHYPAGFPPSVGLLRVTMTKLRVSRTSPLSLRNSPSKRTLPIGRDGPIAVMSLGRDGALGSTVAGTAAWLSEHCQIHPNRGSLQLLEGENSADTRSLPQSGGARRDNQLQSSRLFGAAHAIKFAILASVDAALGGCKCHPRLTGYACLSLDDPTVDRKSLRG
jgi:hypothetical protein